MSPCALLNLSADTLRGCRDGLRTEAMACGSRSERRWGLWACVAAVAVLVVAVALLH